MYGLDVKIINTQDGTTDERRFERFPVRLGRNPLNDLQLESGYVSQFHAILQLDEDRIHLVDLGSRNGTLLPSLGRIPANAHVDLAANGGEFAIAHTIFRCQLVTLEPAAISRRRGGIHDIAEEMTRPHGTDVGAALVTHTKPLYDAYRESWSRLYEKIQTAIGTYDGEMRQKFCEDLMLAHPMIAAEPEFKRLAGLAPSSSATGTGHSIEIAVESSQNSLDPPRDEAVAMAGLRQLASWYLPGAPPPTGVEDVIGFLQTIQDTLDVFLKCFVPLRDGYKQFEVQMDIQRSQGARAYGAPKSSVETARDPRELARAMLDWRQVRGDEPRTVENTFADLMTHQVALLNGVMKGVKSLLNELSPQTIERTLEDPRKNRGGLQIGPFRFKQLWEMYMERHSDLAAEDKEAFALIFGPQFAQAYAQFVETAQPAPGGPGPNNATIEIASVQDPMRGAQRTVPPPTPHWPPRR